MDDTTALKIIYDYYEMDYHILDNGHVLEECITGGWLELDSIGEALEGWGEVIEDFQSTRDLFEMGEILLYLLDKKYS